MSVKMNANHGRIAAHLVIAPDRLRYLKFNNLALVKSMTDDQVMSMVATHLSKQAGMDIRGVAVAPGFHLTAGTQKYFNFNFFNTDDSIGVPELRASLKTLKLPHEVGNFPELFRYGVGKGNFYFVVGEVDRNAGLAVISYIGHVDTPSKFFRRIVRSAPAQAKFDAQLGSKFQSTHFIMPEFAREYVTHIKDGVLY